MRTSIRAARAVAVLLIASGAAGAASTLLPSLDERWIFVVAVAVIGATEGFVIGLISALVAVVAYEFIIHSSMSFTPERDLLLLGAGVASALGARAARVAARPKIRVSQQLLLPPPTLVDEQERFTTALQIDALERKVAREQARADEAERALAELRARAEEDESRIADFDSEIATARGQASLHGMRAAQLEREHGESIARLQSELAAARANAEAIEERAVEMEIENSVRLQNIESELAAARAGADLNGVRVSTRIAELENALSSSRVDAEAHESRTSTRIAELDSALASSRADAEIHDARASRLEREHASHAQEASVRIAEMERELEHAAAHAARIADLENEIAITRTRASIHESRLREAASRVAELEQELARASEHAARIAELENDMTRAAANENTRVAALEHALEAARTASESLAARVAELEETIDTLEREIEALERERDEWSEKLQTIVAHLASDHEVDLGQALLEKEEARAEVRSLTARITELKRMLEERGGDDQRRSVLLIHHDAMLRSMAKNALERNGYRVTTAGDGLEALRIAMTEKPDVILADTQMPKMDGPALVQLLKSRDDTSSMKIILIGVPAASGRNPDFRADDFLRDPANLEEMRATIEHVLQQGHR
jgi:CheY-like chemotaxis protein